MMTMPIESRFPAVSTPAALIRVTVKVLEAGKSEHAKCDALDTAAIGHGKKNNLQIVAAASPVATGVVIEERPRAVNVGNGRIIEIVDQIEVPALARDYWAVSLRDELAAGSAVQFQPIIGDEPIYDKRIHELQGPTYSTQADVVTRTWELAPRDLATVKAELKTQVDDAAERVRQHYLTSGAGQAQEYSEALSEAAAVLALPDPGEATAEQFPMLAASLGVNGAMIADVAEVVMSTYADWKVIGARIRQVRLAGKAAIDAAGDVTSAVAAFDAISWPEP